MPIKETASMLARRRNAPEDLVQVIKNIEEAPSNELASHLEAMGFEWDRPRTDLYVWVPVLNRFDRELAEVIKSNNLSVYPETEPCIAFLDPEEERKVCAILDFSRMLIFHGSNRGIYSSLPYVGALLNVVNSSVVISALYFLLKLSVWYNRERGSEEWKPINKSILVGFTRLVPHRSQNKRLGLRSFLDLLNLQPEWSALTVDYRDDSGSFDRYSVPCEQVQSTSLDALIQNGQKVVPKTDWPLLVSQARLAKACAGDKNLAHDMVTIQTLATGLSTIVLSPQEFRYELLSAAPNSIEEIAKLGSIRGFTDIPEPLNFIALEALDNLYTVRVRPLMLRVMGSFDLMSVLPNLAEAMAKDSTKLNEEYTTLLFKVVVNMVTTGMFTPLYVPLLVDFMKVDTKYIKTQCEVVLLIDDLMIRIPQTINIFLQINGISSVVNCLAPKVDESRIKENLKNERPPDLSKVDYLLSYDRARYIKSFLVLIWNVLRRKRSQTLLSQLMNTEVVPTCMSIILRSHIFGHRTVGLAAQIVSTMIEMEPSIFSSMMESQQLPNAIDHLLKESGPNSKFLKPVFHIVGSLYSLQEGRDLVASMNLIDKTLVLLGQTALAEAETITAASETLSLVIAESQSLAPPIVAQVLNIVRNAGKKLDEFQNDSESHFWQATDASQFQEASEPATIVFHVLHLVDTLLLAPKVIMDFIDLDGIQYIFDLILHPCIPYDFVISRAMAPHGPLKSLLVSIFVLEYKTSSVLHIWANEVGKLLRSIQNATEENRLLLLSNFARILQCLRLMAFTENRSFYRDSLIFKFLFEGDSNLAHYIDMFGTSLDLIMLRHANLVMKDLSPEDALATWPFSQSQFNLVSNTDSLPWGWMLPEHFEAPKDYEQIDLDARQAKIKGERFIFKSCQALFGWFFIEISDYVFKLPEMAQVNNGENRQTEGHEELSNLLGEFAIKRFEVASTYRDIQLVSVIFAEHFDFLAALVMTIRTDRSKFGSLVFRGRQRRVVNNPIWSVIEQRGNAVFIMVLKTMLSHPQPTNPVTNWYLSDTMGPLEFCESSILDYFTASTSLDANRNVNAQKFEDITDFIVDVISNDGLSNMSLSVASLFEGLVASILKMLPSATAEALEAFSPGLNSLEPILQSKMYSLLETKPDLTLVAASLISMFQSFWGTSFEKLVTEVLEYPLDNPDISRIRIASSLSQKPENCESICRENRSHIVQEFSRRCLATIGKECYPFCLNLFERLLVHSSVLSPFENTSETDVEVSSIWLSEFSKAYIEYIVANFERLDEDSIVPAARIIALLCYSLPLTARYCYTSGLLWRLLDYGKACGGGVVGVRLERCIERIVRSNVESEATVEQIMKHCLKHLGMSPPGVTFTTVWKYFVELVGRDFTIALRALDKTCLMVSNDPSRFLSRDVLKMARERVLEDLRKTEVRQFDIPELPGYHYMSNVEQPDLNPVCGELIERLCSELMAIDHQVLSSEIFTEFEQFKNQLITQSLAGAILSENSRYQLAKPLLRKWKPFQCKANHVLTVLILLTETIMSSPSSKNFILAVGSRDSGDNDNNDDTFSTPMLPPLDRESRLLKFLLQRVVTYDESDEPWIDVVQFVGERISVFGIELIYGLLSLSEFEEQTETVLEELKKRGDYIFGWMAKYLSEVFDSPLKKDETTPEILTWRYNFLHKMVDTCSFIIRNVQGHSPGEVSAVHEALRESCLVSIINSCAGRIDLAHPLAKKLRKCLFSLYQSLLKSQQKGSPETVEDDSASGETPTSEMHAEASATEEVSSNDLSSDVSLSNSSEISRSNLFRNSALGLYDSSGDSSLEDEVQDHFRDDDDDDDIQNVTDDEVISDYDENNVELPDEEGPYDAIDSDGYEDVERFESMSYDDEDQMEDDEIEVLESDSDTERNTRDTGRFGPTIQLPGHHRSGSHSHDPDGVTSICLQLIDGSDSEGWEAEEITSSLDDTSRGADTTPDDDTDFTGFESESLDQRSGDPSMSHFNLTDLGNFLRYDSLSTKTSDNAYLQSTVHLKANQLLKEQEYFAEQLLSDDSKAYSRDPGFLRKLSNFAIKEANQTVLYWEQTGLMFGKFIPQNKALYKSVSSTVGEQLWCDENLQWLERIKDGVAIVKLNRLQSNQESDEGARNLEIADVVGSVDQQTPHIPVHEDAQVGEQGPTETDTQQNDSSPIVHPSPSLPHADLTHDALATPTHAQSQEPLAEGANLTQGGAQTDAPRPDSTNANPPDTTDRILVTVAGRVFDITGTGIDPLFLGELPEEIQLEVLGESEESFSSSELTNSLYGSSSPDAALRPFARALDSHLRSNLETSLRILGVSQSIIDDYLSGEELSGDAVQENSGENDNNHLDTLLNFITTNSPESQAQSRENSPRAIESSANTEQPKALQGPLLVADRALIASLLRQLYQTLSDSLLNDLGLVLKGVSQDSKASELVFLAFLKVLYSATSEESLNKGYMNATRASGKWTQDSRFLKCDASHEQVFTQALSCFSAWLHSLAEPAKVLLLKHKDKFLVNRIFGLLDKQLFLENEPALHLFSELFSNIVSRLVSVGKIPKFKEVPPAILANLKESTNTLTSGDLPTQSNTLTAIEPTQNSGELSAIQIPKSLVERLLSISIMPECSMNTFRHILTGLQDSFGMPNVLLWTLTKLQRDATRIAKDVLRDLTKLCNGIVLDRHVIKHFTSNEASQTKLLKVLTAADFLLDPKKLQTPLPLFEIFMQDEFISVWNELGTVLSLCDSQHLYVSTTLLPSIECLTLCSKRIFGAAKLASESENPNLARVKVSLEAFSHEHKKVLNTLVRQSPKLLSGSFAVLARDPRILDFDNKQAYFRRRTQQEKKNLGRTDFNLRVRRESVFLDTYRALFFISATEIKQATICVKFAQELGYDAGGLTREWLDCLSKQICNPDYALFIPLNAAKTAYHPNRASWVNPEHLSYFKFVGRIIGKAIYDGRIINCYFSRAVYKRLLNVEVTLEDMEAVDEDYYNSLKWMLNNDITDVITETFAIEVDDYGVEKELELKEGGANIPVTEENKKEYVDLLVEYKLVTSVKEQMDQFVLGFTEIVPLKYLSLFDGKELELLICGLPDIDLDDWRINTKYSDYTVDSPQIRWFWRAVASFDQEERAKLLQFTTGTARLPLSGFAQLESSGGTGKFTIVRDVAGKERWPSAHTCTNQLNLPVYSSYEELRLALLRSITQGASGFGFA